MQKSPSEASASSPIHSSEKVSTIVEQFAETFDAEKGEEIIKFHNLHLHDLECNHLLQFISLHFITF